jgi:hypothetical protein
MKIELKNFKHFPTLSEETYCFTATLVVNGIKCGTAKNQGFGGSTSVYSDHTPKGMKLIEEAENYCKSLPPYYIGKLCTIDMNLENFIDDLVNTAVIEKARLKDEKRLAKNMVKSFLYGNEREMYSLTFNMPILDAIARNPQAVVKDVKNYMKKHEGKGYRILNTNLPQSFLSEL